MAYVLLDYLMLQSSYTLHYTVTSSSWNERPGMYVCMYVAKVSCSSHLAPFTFYFALCRLTTLPTYRRPAVSLATIMPSWLRPINQQSGSF